MQSDQLDIIEALTALLQTVKETEKLSTLSLDQWPMYTSTLEKCIEEDGKVVYQCQDLKHFSSAKSYYVRTSLRRMLF